MDVARIHNFIQNFKIISQVPNWQIDNPDFGSIINQLFYSDLKEVSQTEIEEINVLKRQFVLVVASALENGTIDFGNGVFNDNQFRQPIKKLIVHHTSGDNNFWLNPKHSEKDLILYLNSLQFLRLTAYYRSFKKLDFKGNLVYAEEYGKPLSLGRFLPGSIGFSTQIENFIQYHYLVFHDGKVLQLADSNQLLWHASGNNEDSLSVCIIGNYDEQIPTNESLNSLRKLIKSIKNEFFVPEILGHFETYKNGRPAQTTCPGRTYQSLWRDYILKND